VVQLVLLAAQSYTKWRKTNRVPVGLPSDSFTFKIMNKSCSAAQVRLHRLENKREAPPTSPRRESLLCGTSFSPSRRNQRPLVSEGPNFSLKALRMISATERGSLM
jgi:hypothetical protein